MGALIDLTGEQFGHLRVITRLEDRVTASGARQPMWGCQCACGRRSAEEGRALRARRALSCRDCVRDPSRTLKYAQTYVAYWPQRGVLKVGRAWRSSRLEQLSEDAIIIFCMSGTDETWEREALHLLRNRFPTAFTNAHQAEDLLRHGHGYSECVNVNNQELDEALELCMQGFARGNDLGYNPPATPSWRQTFTQLRTARRARRRGDVGGAAPDRISGDTDAAGRGDDRRPAVAEGGAGDIDRPRRGAPAATRGDETDHDRDRTGRARVDSPRRSSIFTGCKRECACERAGACASGRVGESERPAAGAAPSPPMVPGCSADRVRRSSAWFSVPLRSMPHRPPQPRNVYAPGSCSRSSRPVGVRQRSGRGLGRRIVAVGSGRGSVR